MSKGRILFTGGGGFVGSQLVPLLERHGWDVIKPRSSQVRLDDEKEVDTLFEEENYHAIIHAAIVGGRRGREDTEKVFMTNMRMFENIFRYVEKCGVFINLDSGASLGRPALSEEPNSWDLGKIIPADPYGFSKYCIAQRVLSHGNGRNLRIWGCFGPDETQSRFFSNNIKNYIQKKDMVINKDRKMDFIYSEDLYQIINYYLTSGNHINIKDFNCVYYEKYYLSEIAKMINSLDDYKVNINIEGSSPDYSYCGAPYSIGLKYLGLKHGIKECWSQWK